MRIAPIALAASIIAPLTAAPASFAETPPAETARPTDALQKLGLSLINAMPHDGNSIVSPFSLGAALDLIAIGGNDAVRSAVANTTGIGASSTQGLPTLSARNRQMASSARSAGISLEIANAVWPDNSVQLAPGFIDAEKRDAEARTTRLDVTSKAAMRTINEWVARATHGHIPTLYDDPPSDTPDAVIVTDALYFKGAWEDPFDPKLTSRQPFHSLGAPDTAVELMSKAERFAYREEPAFQAVELYFGNNACFALTVVLPKRADIDPATLIEDAGFRDALQGNGYETARGTVMLPHLDIGQTLSPVELLGDADAIQAIRQPEALSRMFVVPPKEIALRSIQKVVMTLDEKGATAAAATGIAVSATAAPLPSPLPPFEFRADHPFWFALRDRMSGTVLMTGIVRRP